MGKEAQQEALFDTCVLINFLRVDQVGLLVRHPAFRILITNHVRNEVSEHYPEQLNRLNAAIASGQIIETTVESEQEIEVFSALIQQGRFGIGECSSIAAAVVRGVPLATDDQTARKHILRAFPELQMLDTQSLIVDLLRANMIDVTAADALKNQWATEHKFLLRITSFSDLL